MPLVHLHLREGRTPEQKRALVDAVHQAFVEAFKIPVDDRNYLLHEHDAAHFEAQRGPDTVFVEAFVFPGRSKDAKRALYRAIVANLDRAGVNKDHVLIVLNEPPLENWGVRGGQAACDVAIGFKLDV
jgi:phenylpyruvate tautomerase PptA (4-oxalocrotonate tautomerase family)